MENLKLWIFKLGITLLVLIATWTISGCGGTAPDIPTPTPAATVAWNFLVYLDGDNDLEAEAVIDFNEMELIGSTGQVNVLVLFDRNPYYDYSNGDWTGTRLYKITHDTNPSVINSQLLVDYGEKDMSDPATLQDFIKYCQTYYPANHTVLTLWNHGAGVYPKAVQPDTNLCKTSGSTNTKGICWDNTTGSFPWNCLTTDEVAAALAAARNATGQKIDIINLDACLMQLLEVAYEWKDQADYLVGSEETIPGTGDDYDTVLGRLTGNPDVAPGDFAIQLVEDFYNYYNGWANTTYSALDLSAITGFMPVFQTLATELKQAFVNQEASRGVIYSAGTNCTSFTQYQEIIDLYSFCNRLGANVTTDPELVSAANAVKTAFGNLVITHRETGIYKSDIPAYGLAINLPWNQTVWNKYSGSNRYVSLALSTVSDWDEFVINFAAYGSTL